MSRLATENKAGRATKGNTHRKRKMAEAFPPAATSVGIAKLNPNSKTLPPLSMGQPQSNTAPGSQLQQPSFQGSLVSASQPVSFVRSNSQPPPGLPSMNAKKRVKVESAAAVSAPGVSFQSGSKQSTGSKQALGAKRAGPIKQTSGSRQSSEDAQTRTDGSSKPAASRHPSPPPADSVDSAAAHRIAASGAAPQTQQATLAPEEEQVTFPFRIVKAKTAQPAGSSGHIGNSSVAHTAAVQPAASKPAMPAAAVSASVAKPADTPAAASVGGDNCMNALAEAAAAASEGSAASSSSHTDDDKDAAEILRDLHNSAGLPQNISPDASEGQNALQH